jgi:hypothetical protein
VRERVAAPSPPPEGASAPPSPPPERTDDEAEGEGATGEGAPAEEALASAEPDVAADGWLKQALLSPALPPDVGLMIDRSIDVWDAPAFDARQLHRLTNANGLVALGWRIWREQNWGTR